MLSTFFCRYINRRIQTTSFTMLRSLFVSAVMVERLRSQGACAFTASTPRPSYSAISVITSAPERSGGGRSRRYQDPRAPRGPTWLSGSARLYRLSPPRARSAWPRNARGDKEEENDKPNLPGSGLRGVDTSYLEGNEKANAEWFRRTAEREARGQLAWYEDPVIYIAILGLVPLLILAWGVVNCYVPGFCESSF